LFFVFFLGGGGIASVLFLEQVVRNLVNNIYAAPNQLAFIKDMQEVGRPQPSPVILQKFFYLFVLLMPSD